MYHRGGRGGVSDFSGLATALKISFYQCSAFFWAAIFRDTCIMLILDQHCFCCITLHMEMSFADNCLGMQIKVVNFMNESLLRCGLKIS